MSERTEVEAAMAAVRVAVERQRLNGVGEMAPPLDPRELVRFSPDLPPILEPAARDELTARIAALAPWLQGPFYLGGDLVVDGEWRIDDRWVGLREHVGDLRGARVLDVGTNAGYDAFMFHRHGAAEVLAVEPHEFVEQARFLEGIYRTGVRFERLGWQELDPAEHGRFDLVHCHGVLYHEAHPVALLERLRAMVAPGGRLLLGSMVLADPELSECARFVPGAYAGDPSWWWVPGRLALRWMVEAVGFEVTEELPLHPGPRGAFPTENAYLAATPTHRTPGLTRTTSSGIA